MTEIYVVFENEEPVATFDGLERARDFIDCNCMPEDDGARFELVLFTRCYTLDSHRSAPHPIECDLDEDCSCRE